MNEAQAAQHEKRMKQLLEAFNDEIREQWNWDPDKRTAYKTYVESVKNLVAAIIDPVKEARTDRILDSIADHGGHHIRRGFDSVTKEATGVDVEEVDVEAPDEMKARVTANKRMTRVTSEALTDLFTSVAEVHQKQHTVAMKLADLGKEMNPDDYLDVVRAVAKPAIVMRFPEHLMPVAVTETEEEGDLTKRAEKLRKRMVDRNLPDPKAPSLRGEGAESPTRILAAVIHYELGKRFVGNTTQTSVATLFGITMTNMKKGITGKKYKGGEPKKKKEEPESTQTLPDLPKETPSGLVVTQRPSRAAKKEGEGKRRASEPKAAAEQQTSQQDPWYVPEDDDDDDDEPEEEEQPPKKRPKTGKGKGKGKKS